MLFAAFIFVVPLGAFREPALGIVACSWALLIEVFQEDLVDIIHNSLKKQSGTSHTLDTGNGEQQSSEDCCQVATAQLCIFFSAASATSEGM